MEVLRRINDLPAVPSYVLYAVMFAAGLGVVMAPDSQTQLGCNLVVLAVSMIVSRGAYNRVQDPERAARAMNPAFGR